MKIEDCIVAENKKIAKDTFKMKINGSFVEECKSPGQFVNIRIGDGKEYMLRRPISISEINREKNQITIIYKVVGEGTKILSKQKENTKINIIGPLGKGYDIFTLRENQIALLVGGGIGVPPLYELAKQFHTKGVKTIAILGFNSKDEIFYEEKFKKFGEVYVSTVDGSYGTKGFVTDVIKENNINFDKFYSCGPVPMLKALVDNIGENGYISLENRMACGIGACYACVCKKKVDEDVESYDEKKVHYTRVCYDGPVYSANQIEF